MMPKLIQKIYRLVTTHPFLYIVTFFSVFLSVSYFCCFFVVAIMYNDFHINVFCHAKYKYVTGITEWINLLYCILKIYKFSWLKIFLLLGLKYIMFSVYRVFPTVDIWEGLPALAKNLLIPYPHQITKSAYQF